MASSPSPASYSASVERYALAVVLTTIAVLSQYFVPQLVPALRPVYANFLGGLLIVYGLPIVALATLVGVGPLTNYRRGMPKAAWEGVRWFGLLSALAFVVTFVLLVVYTIVDRSAVELLQRQNPVLTEAAHNPLFWVLFAFAIGAIEETIFRGWVFGFWLNRGRSPWWVHATWTSALFAGVHLYYGQTYGVASPILYPTLFLLGFSFAAAFHSSGGNLVVVALLHGGNDAASFLTLLSPSAALAAHYGLIGVGLLLALIQYVYGSPFEPRRPTPASAGGFGAPPALYPFLPPPPPPVPPPPPAPPMTAPPVTLLNGRE